MSKIIFYTDLHHGQYAQKTSEGVNISLWGDYALEMVEALNHYAQTHDYQTIIHGGDESLWTREKEMHKTRANEAKEAITNTTCQVVRAIGNHEPLNYIDRFPKSGIVTDTPIATYLCQPDILKEDGKTIYEHPQSMPMDIINAANNNDGLLIVAGHYAFDRQEQDWPKIYPPNNNVYGYRETLHKQKDFSFEKPIPIDALENPNGQILSLHGHEHRFRLTTHGRFNCLTMPSIVQHDIIRDYGPCGLFCSIEKTKNTLSVQFKKINLHALKPKESTVTDVDIGYMQKHYFRPVAKY